MTSPDSIDWEAVRNELAATDRSLAGLETLSARAEANLLRERARLLARELEPEATASEQLQVLEFRLGDDRYGFELEAICEVTRGHHVTRVPCTPAFVAGIINLRGEILTVINLKKLFNLPAESSPGADKVIVVESAGLQLGIIADVVCGVRSLRVADLQSPPATLTGLSAEHVRGITTDRLVVLDVGKVLSDPRLLVHDQNET